MKYLSDYTQEKQTQLFEETGAFFAFWQKQFDEQRKEWVIYVSLDGGLLVPKDRAKEFVDRLHGIGKTGIRLDIEENWIEWIIKRELWNHEAYYTGDIESTCHALDGYGITREQVHSVFRNQNKIVS